jgi:hypothetical protein
MRKAGILTLVVLCAPLLLAAQEKPPAPPEQWQAVTCYVPTQAAQPQAQPATPQMPKRPHPLDPADVETLTGRPYEGANWGRAPKPGHPLDWNDVAILTGKAGGSSGNYSGYAYGVTPYMYVSPYTPMFGHEYFTPSSTRVRPLFAPRLFPRMVANPIRNFR